MGERYSGELLHVNLGQGRIDRVEVDAETMARFVGGTGLAARLVMDKTDAATQPLSESSPLVVMTGPLSGTAVPGSSRCVIAGLSPLTGIWGETYLGGTWPYMLRRTPYMGIVVTGQAQKPVLLWIEGEQARLESAEHLWGKDTYQTHELVTAQAPGTSLITIGQAGENQVKMASVMGDGRAGRAAARCGLGALMGSKRLKAIVAHGEGKPKVAHPQQLKASINRLFPRLGFNPERWREKNADGWLPHVNRRGCVKNFTRGKLPGFGEKMFDLAMEATPWYCTGCRTGCFVSMMFTEYRHPPGQHMQPFGSNCLIENTEALLEAFDWCNRYGLDAISTGQTIAFAMELYEKGLLSKEDTGGIELTWGNHQAMLQVLHLIGRRQGVGELLGMGVREVAQQVGGNAAEYALHVKGLPFPQYDPRTGNNIALQYATTNRGAHHMDGWIGLVARAFTSYYPDYPLPYKQGEEDLGAISDPFAVAGMGKQLARSQNYSNFVDSLGVCLLMTIPMVWVREPEEPASGVLPDHFLEWLNLVTGWDMDRDGMVQTGERIFNLKRLINTRRGISRKDDMLPPRMLTRKRGGDGPAAENLPHLGAMLNEYYACRGWSEEGIPTAEKLKELGLTEYLSHAGAAEGDKGQ